MSGKQQPNVAERLKANAVSLAMNFKAINNSAIEKGYNFVKREMAVFIELYLSRIDARTILQTFAEYSYEYWGEISVRDHNFFGEHAENVFNFNSITDSELNAVVGNTRNVVLFKQLLNNTDAVTEDDKILFWKHFEAMVRLTWKAVLEDEARPSNCKESEFWISKHIREAILNMDNLEEIVSRIEQRKNERN